jgi:integrase/recombinase XerC
MSATVPQPFYTHVSDDFMNTALSRALAPAFAGT